MIMHEHMDCYFSSLKFFGVFFVIPFLPGIWAKIQGEQVTAFISLMLYCIPAVISQLTTGCVFYLHASSKSIWGEGGVVRASLSYLYQILKAEHDVEGWLE